MAKVAGIRMELTRREAHEILDEIEDIEIRDDKRGFNASELRAAKAYLVKKGFISKSTSLSARTLTRFFVKFSQKVRWMPGEYETNCRIVDCNGEGPVRTLLHCPGSERRVCDQVTYSIRFMIGDKLAINDVEYRSDEVPSPPVAIILYDIFRGGSKLSAK